MDLKQLEYIMAIEKYGNMTAAAERLFITPSALNQQLTNLESELGIPLFTRTKRKMIPTIAGKIYLENGTKMLQLRQDTYNQLQDLTESYHGTYHIGVTYDHGFNVFTAIYEQFHNRYPGVQLRCDQKIVPELLELLRSNRLDMVFLLTGNPLPYSQEFDYIPLSTENLVLGIPASNPLTAGDSPSTSPNRVFDISLLKNENFALAQKGTTIRQELVDPIFKKAGFRPHIMIESCINHFLESLTVKEMGCCIIPQTTITNRTDIVWYYLPGHPRFHLALVFLKSMHRNNAINYFIELSRVYAQEHLNFPVPPND